jgi:hypothetical protein
MDANLNLEHFGSVDNTVEHRRYAKSAKLTANTKT